MACYCHGYGELDMHRRREVFQPRDTCMMHHDGVRFGDFYQTLHAVPFEEASMSLVTGSLSMVVERFALGSSTMAACLNVTTAIVQLRQEHVKSLSYRTT